MRVVEARKGQCRESNPGGIVTLLGSRCPTQLTIKRIAMISHPTSIGNGG